MSFNIPLDVQFKSFHSMLLLFHYISDKFRFNHSLLYFHIDEMFHHFGLFYEFEFELIIPSIT